MTAFAIDYRADRAIIASDGIAYDDAKQHVGFVAKIYPLHHIRAVVFGRGPLVVTVGTVAGLMLSPGISTIEEAATALPDILRRVTEEWAEATGQGDLAGQHYHDLHIIGWSEAEARMRAWGFASTNDFAADLGFDRNYGGVYSLPPLPVDFAPLDRSDTPLDEKLATRLKALDRFCEAKPDIVKEARLGGEILAVEVTERTVKTRAIGAFPDFEARVAADQQTATPKTAADRKKVDRRKAERRARKNGRKGR